MWVWAIRDDQRFLTAIRPSSIAVYRMKDDLERIIQLSLTSKTDRSIPCRFLPSAWPSERTAKDLTVVWRDDNAIHRRVIDIDSQFDSDRRQSKRTIDSLRTEMLGAKLRDSEFDLHSSKELIAVAFAGGLEIWNARFQTVAQVPSVDCVWDVIPMQLHDKCLLLKQDGGGIVVRTRGEPLGKVIPPVAARHSGYDVIQRNSVIEPELDLVQSTYRWELSPAQRKLTDFGLVAVTTPSRHTFSFVPKQSYLGQLTTQNTSSITDPSDWHYGTTYDPIGLDDLKRINRHYHPVITDSYENAAIAHRAERLVLCDPIGRYQVHRLNDIDNPPEVEGKNGRSQRLFVDHHRSTSFHAVRWNR